MDLSKAIDRYNGRKRDIDQLVGALAIHVAEKEREIQESEAEHARLTRMELGIADGDIINAPTLARLVERIVDRLVTCALEGAEIGVKKNGRSKRKS